MAEAYQCDRCKKLFTGNDFKHIVFNPNHQASSMDRKAFTFEICDDCYKDIENYVAMTSFFDMKGETEHETL